MKVYLFCFMDGEFGWTKNKPTEVDWAAAESGDISILELPNSLLPIKEMITEKIGSEVPELILEKLETRYHRR